MIRQRRFPVLLRFSWLDGRLSWLARRFKHRSCVLSYIFLFFCGSWVIIMYGEPLLNLSIDFFLLVGDYSWPDGAFPWVGCSYCWLCFFCIMWNSCVLGAFVKPLSFSSSDANFRRSAKIFLITVATFSGLVARRLLTNRRRLCFAFGKPIKWPLGENHSSLDLLISASINCFPWMKGEFDVNF